MTSHTPENKKWQIATIILEGSSYSEVSKQFGISKAGAAKIFHKMKFKIFPLLSERGKYNINMNDIKSLRNAWRQISRF